MSTKNSMIEDLFSSILSDELKPFINKEIEEEIYDEKPVGIIEFTESRKYLGLGDAIYVPNKYILCNIERDDIREVGLLLGKGVGKSTIAGIFLTYGIYKCLCMKEPQKYYNLLPGTPLISLLVSTSEAQAKGVVFAIVKEMLRNSTFFSNRYEELSTEIRFDKNIKMLAGHSGATSFLGLATFRAAMDEVEWMVNSSNRSVASELYRALKGSLITRFGDKYKLLMLSSPNAEFSYLNSRFTDVKKRGQELILPNFKDGKYLLEK